MRIDLGDESKLTVVAHLMQRGKSELAEYVAQGVSDPEARSVVHAILVGAPSDSPADALAKGYIRRAKGKSAKK